MKTVTPKTFFSIVRIAIVSAWFIGLALCAGHFANVAFDLVGFVYLGPDERRYWLTLAGYQSLFWLAVTSFLCLACLHGASYTERRAMKAEAEV